MKNELLSIGPFTIYGYGLMIGIGIVAAYLVTEYRAKKGTGCRAGVWSDNFFRNRRFFGL